MVLLTAYEDQVVAVRAPFHTLTLIINMIFPGIGTILNSISDVDEGGVRWTCFLIGLL